jgi:ferredoxin
MRTPVIEIGDCVLCGICVELCPSVFALTDLGYVEVTGSVDLPEDDINEAIKNCPADCISWEDL